MIRDLCGIAYYAVIVFGLGSDWNLADHNVKKDQKQEDIVIRIVCR